MSDEEKKALDRYIGNLIDEKIQNKGIVKDVKNGKQNISWKDWTIGIATILGMLTVIYFSANANTVAKVTEADLSNHKEINEEQFRNIQENIKEMKQDIKDIRAALYIKDKK